MTTEGPKILLIEDEQEIRRFLRVSLGGQGYRLVESATGRDGVMQAASQQPDLMILDLGLPDIDGMEVIRQVREWSHMPIIILSARGQEHQKVDALDAGADDYLTKPFSVGELVARIRVALRHVAQDAGESGEPVFVLGGLRVDLVRRQVFVGDEEIHLTPIEYRLLTTLIKHAGKGHHPQAASQGGLGAGQRLRNALSSRLHGPASPQDRSRPRPAEIPPHRTRRRLPFGIAMTLFADRLIAANSMKESLHLGSCRINDHMHPISLTVS